MFGHQDQSTNDQPADVLPPDDSLNNTSAATVAEPAGAPTMPNAPASVPSSDGPATPDPTITHTFGESEPQSAGTQSSLAGQADDEDLLGIKQQALGQLSPLVNHLDQSPEEKFRTVMMLIQAADDQSLIKSAYEAAQNIPDEKARAQALLDVVNEINYFTQHQAA